MSRAWPAVSRTSLTRPIASASARDRLLSAAANSLVNSWSPRLNAASRSAMRTRSSGSRMPSTSTHRPNRSSSCGRSSPSSGFMVPTRMKCAGWLNETPSRSITLTPLVAGVAAEVAALDDVVLGQQAGEGADGGRLARALLASDQDAADRGHDGVQDQGELHRLLAHDRRERVRVPVDGDAH